MWSNKGVMLVGWICGIAGGIGDDNGMFGA